MRRPDFCFFYRQPTPLVVLAVVLAGMATGLFIASCGRKAPPTANPYQMNIEMQTSPERVQAGRIMRLVNEERMRKGLHTLLWSDELAELGLRHSEEMKDRTDLDQEKMEDLVKTTDFNAAYFLANAVKERDVFRGHHKILEEGRQYRRLLDPEITHIGVGIYHPPGTKKKWKKHIPFLGRDELWITEVMAKNPAKWREIRKKQLWDEFIQRELAQAKVLDVDLNYAQFNPEEYEKSISSTELPPGWQISIPALQEPQWTPPVWSVLDQEATTTPPTPTPEPPTPTLPVSIIIATYTPEAGEPTATPTPEP
jgi:hypothetical protein